MHRCVTLYSSMKVRGKHIQPAAGPEKAFGEAFRTLREKRRISQEAVCEKAGCDRTTISLIERGVVSAKLNTVVKICKAISILPSDVMKAMERSLFYP